MPTYQSIHPATEELIAKYESTSDANLAKILEAQDRAFRSWRLLPLTERLKPVSAFRKIAHAKQESLSQLITSEMGKVKKDAEREVHRLLLYCDYALEHAERIFSKRNLEIPGGISASSFLEPMGCILAITPWNVPLATPCRSVLPAIVGGNAVLVKPAPNVAGSALALEAMLLEAGFPEYLVKVVLLENAQAEALIADRHIRKISFVGSTAVGERLASIAGAHAKPALLELGGSDPFIVLADADIETAAADAAAARCNNSGQVCCSSKRMIIETSVYEHFRELFVEHMRNKKTGDPMAEDTDYGPLARADILERLVSQVEKAKQSGSRVLLEGGRMDGRGYFFRPVVFEENGDRGFSTDEEFFGPVASLYRADDLQHALHIANLSQYGLGSAVYTKSQEKAERVARDIESGFLYVNSRPGLHPYLPFGGVKRSGFGRDGGDSGYLEFVHEKVAVGQVS